MRKLEDGEALASSLGSKVAAVESMLEALDSTKKHLDNKEFVQLIAKKKKVRVCRSAGGDCGR